MLVVGILGIDFEAIFQRIVDWFYNIWYGIDILLCKLLGLLYNIFEVFVGTAKVTYNGSSSYLLDVFFGNSTISKIYWGMALIGIVLAFAFAMISVVRKMFDADEKVKSTIGGIIRKLLQSIIMILLMNFIILVVLNATNLLTQQVTYLFDNSEVLGQAESYTFTTADYATMARIYDKIGNYSLNDSRDSRYNINACFNDIRSDLQSLESRGVFDFTYDANTWQGVLKDIATCHDLSEDQDLDENNTNLNAAILNAMVVLETYDNFKPVDSVTRENIRLASQNVPLDVIVFQMGMMDRAKNSTFNKEASLFDALRYDYISGAKSIYNLDTVRGDFNINDLGCHLLIIISAILIFWEFLKITLNCVARIFNMILLYISFPPFAATLSLDDGAKLKQWITAFIIQSLSVFGTLIGVRLLMLMIPIVFNANLQLFPNTYMNAIAKLIFLIGLSFTTEKASSMITGILADQAGFQAVQASSSGSAAAGAVAQTGAAIGQKAYGIGRKVAGTGGRIAGGAYDRTVGTWSDKLSDSFAKTEIGQNLSNFRSKVGSALQSWTPSGAAEYRGRMHNLNQLKSDLNEAGETGDNTRKMLASMDYDTASSKFGLDHQELDALRIQYGGGAGTGGAAETGAGRTAGAGSAGGGAGGTAASSAAGQKVASVPPTLNRTAANSEPTNLNRK